MAATVKVPATYQEILSLPGDRLGQIIGGELISLPQPPIRHACISALFGNELIRSYDRGVAGADGWWILEQPELQLGEDVLAPDLTGWRRARLHAFPRSFPVDLLPDWVGEVLWPGSAGLDRVHKMPLYAQAGVQHVWLIDPIERALEVYRLEGGRLSMISGFTGDAPCRAEPFEDMELPLGRLWGTGG